MRVRNLSVSGKGSVEHLATVNPVYINKSPARQRPFALSTYLPAQQPNFAVLNSVIMRFCDPLIALVFELDQPLTIDCGVKQMVQFLIYCH